MCRQVQLKDGRSVVLKRKNNVSNVNNFHISFSAVLCESRLVKVPAGPLVCVEGQSVSIRCDVSDYEGPREQDFEWNLVLDSENSVALISTFDQAYTDPSMKDRINSGDISVKKLADDAVELTIKKVRASDSTIYRCSTPSTDSNVKGNYFADVELKGGLYSSHCCFYLSYFYTVKQNQMRPINSKLKR